MKVLIFDVETTGLLPKILKKEDIEKYPHVIQLSYILYDCERNNIIDYFNNYIILNRKIKISKKVTELTGIDKELTLTGVSIMTALERFSKAYEEADNIVAHNLEFDSKMILIEMYRNEELIKKLNKNILNLKNVNRIETEKEKYCTMKNGRYICNIKKLSNDGKEYYLKWPKLIELYEKLFNKRIDNLHNSLVDTVACLRCYLKMTGKKELSDEITEGIIDYLI